MDGFQSVVCVPSGAVSDPYGGRKSGSFGDREDSRTGLGGEGGSSEKTKED